MYEITRKTVSDILGLYLPIDIIIIIGAICYGFNRNLEYLLLLIPISLLFYRLLIALIFLLASITDLFYNEFYKEEIRLKPELKLLLQIIFFSMIPIIVYPFITFIGIPYELPFIGLLSVLSTYKGFLIAYFFYENP